jgi:death on curing protein
VTVRYLGLDDYVAVTVEVTGQQVETLVNATKTGLADSALHALVASFGDQEFYPDFIDKAAVLVVRPARNHPLPDGNKRAAWASLRLFLAYNGCALDPYPSVDEAEAVVLAIASGTWDEAATADRC